MGEINIRLLLLMILLALAMGWKGMGPGDATRTIDISLASDKGVAKFVEEARALGGVEGVTLYMTVGSDRLEYAAFPRELKRVTLVLKFTREACGGPVFSQILAGAIDEKLIAFSEAVNGAGRRIIVRPFHEYNLGFHPWSIYAKDNDPSQFVAVWRHVVGLLRAHSSLMEFDFNPNRESFTYQGKRPPGGRETGFAGFYPGDEWVDWVSISSYNRGFLRESDQRSHSFAEGFRVPYRIMDGLAGSRVRFAISETSTTDYGGIDKRQWFEAMLQSVAEDFRRVEIIGLFLIDKHNTSAGEKPALWGLHGEAEYAMLGQALADFRRRLGMPEPPRF